MEAMTDINQLSSHRWEFAIQRLPKVSFMCTSANIPDVNVTPAMTGTPFNQLHFTPDKVTFSELIVTYIVDENMENYRAVFDWMIGLGAPTEFEEHEELVDGDGIYSDATLIIQNNNKQPNVLVELKNIFPISLTGIPLDVANADVDPVKVTATFVVQSYSMRRVNA